MEIQEAYIQRLQGLEPIQHSSFVRFFCPKQDNYFQFLFENSAACVHRGIYAVNGPIVPY